MRGLVSFLAFLGVLGGGVVLLLPLIVGFLITSALGSTAFAASERNVQVQGWGGELLDATAPGVEFHARDARYEDLSAASLDLTLTDVHLLDRRFRSVEGTARGASVAWAGQTLGLTQVTFSGPAQSTDVTARVEAAEVERLVRSAAGDRLGSDVRVTVSAAGIRLTAGGRTATATLVVERGTLVLRTPLGAIPILVAPPSELWRFTDVETASGSIILRAKADLISAAEQAGLIP